jgi:hypothetical protein
METEKRTNHYLGICDRMVTRAKRLNVILIGSLLTGLLSSCQLLLDKKINGQLQKKLNK